MTSPDLTKDTYASNTSDHPTPRFSVSDFVAIAAQTLSFALDNVEIEGEVMNYKVYKDKWIFFDLKDDASTVPCFMSVFQPHAPISDGMKVVVLGSPRFANTSRFSFTVRNIQPLGKGNIKKSFELLKAKLTSEGLFASEKKRPLPEDIKAIGVISSVAAAGYADFIKIVNERWGGLNIKVADCGVQGLAAIDEIIRSLDYFNQEENVDIIAIIRGGGSADDLAIFNDEQLARIIASSRTPVITGIGHEIDESLADLAADIRASTPSNAATILTRDKNFETSKIISDLSSLEKYLLNYIDTLEQTSNNQLLTINREIQSRITQLSSEIANKRQLLDSLNPESILKKGYSILSGKISPGSSITITTSSKLIQAKVETINDR